MKNINQIFSNGTQSINYKGTFEYKKNKIKVSIKKDSYDMQSHGNVNIWDKNTLKWNRIDHIPFAELQVNIGKVFYQRKVDEKGNGLTYGEKQAFANDTKTLLKLAQDVLD